MDEAERALDALPALPDQRVNAPATERERLLLRPLYGGAMQCLLARRFVDASAVRQVPDSQEVFLDADADESVLVDVVELQEAPFGEEAARFFARDMAESAGAAAFRFLGWRALGDGDAPGLGGLPRLLSVAEMDVSKFREDALNTVRFYMLVVRLERVGTDLLVTYNVPVRISPDSSVADRPVADSLEHHRAVLASVVRSFKITDWRLFTGPDDEE